MADEIKDQQEQPQEEQPTEAKPEEADKAEKKAKPKYTDEDVDSIVNRAIARERQRADEEKKKLTEAQKLEKMNEDEKARYELEKLKEDNKKLQATLDFNEQKRIARAQLNDAGITVSDDLLEMFVSTDADKTKAAVDGFQKLFRDELNKGIQDALKRTPPKAEPKDGGTSEGAAYAKKYNDKNVPK